MSRFTTGEYAGTSEVLVRMVHGYVPMDLHKASGQSSTAYVREVRRDEAERRDEDTPPERRRAARRTPRQGKPVTAA